MKVHHSPWSWLFVPLLLAWPAPAPGQGSAQISGVVEDEQGAVLPGATLTLRNQETGVTRTAVTEADGRYRFGALSPGRYSLKAEVDGFQALEIQDLILTIGFQMTQDLSLKLAALEETITVTGESPQVEIANTEVSSLITKEQIAQLPINSRSYLSLSLLVPGVSSDVNRGFFESVQVGGGSTFNSTRNIVDGVTNNWIEDGEPRQDIPEDAVEQFKVSNAQFKPEFGMATAGVIQIVTKSGTNSVHGTAYEYFRDKALNAKGVFEDEKQQRANGHATGRSWLGYPLRVFRRRSASPRRTLLLAPDFFSRFLGSCGGLILRPMDYPELQYHLRFDVLLTKEGKGREKRFPPSCQGD
jgi:Carboxypeptidase regulatory-like domain